MIKPPIIYRKRAKEEAIKNYGSKWIEYAFKDHVYMSKRLKKTLYYGKQPKTDRPSMPMTELTVEMFSDAAPQTLEDVNMNFAASVSRNACISPCSMILALAYLERLRTRSPEYLQNISSSNLFLVSMLVASKFLYDEGEDEEVFNDEWASAANIETKEMNDLEMKFLSAIDWNVYMDPKQFNSLLAKLECVIAQRKVKDRGWCTYTDLDVLTEHLDYAKCWQYLSDYFIKVLALSAVVYVTTALAMVGTLMVTKKIERAVLHLIPIERFPVTNEIFGNESSPTCKDDNENCKTFGLHINDLIGDRNFNSYNSAFVGNEINCKIEILNENYEPPFIIIDNKLFDARAEYLKPGIVQNFSSVTDYLLNLSPYVDLTMALVFR